MRTGKYDINTVHETKKSGQLEVIDYIDVNHRRVRFVDTGFITKVSVSALSRGDIKDPMTRSVFGVGYIGHNPELENHPLRKMLYHRWTNMLQRVYRFKLGKSISPEWLCFYTFMADALQLKGNDLLQQHSKENRIDLDSDILAIEKGVSPVYSKETCQWIPCSENIRVRRTPKHYFRYPIGSSIETKHGPVTIVEKDNNRWLVRFDDSREKWFFRQHVLHDRIAKP